MLLWSCDLRPGLSTSHLERLKSNRLYLGMGKGGQSSPTGGQWRGAGVVFLAVKAGLGNGFSVVSPALSSSCDVRCPPRSYKCLDSCTAIAMLPFSAP